MSDERKSHCNQGLAELWKFTGGKYHRQQLNEGVNEAHCLETRDRVGLGG